MNDCENVNNESEDIDMATAKFKVNAKSENPTKTVVDVRDLRL